MLPTDLPQYVLDRPVLVVGLTLVLLALANWQAGLTYREYRLAHRVKVALFAGLDDRAGGYLLGPVRELVARVVDERTAVNVTQYIDDVTDDRPLVQTKGYRDDPSFVRTEDASPRAVYRTLSDVGDGHLIATAKRRETPTGLQWAHSQLVFRHGDGTQTEVFLFDAGDEGTDIYAHLEGVFTDPRAHLRDDQRQGDHHDILPVLLDGETPEALTGPTP